MPRDSRFPLKFQSLIKRVAETQALYERTKDLNALKEMLVACESILCHSDFSICNSEFQLRTLNLTGGAYLTLYRMTGDTEALDRCLELWQWVVLQAAPDSLYACGCLYNLGNAARAKYGLTGNQVDLDNAIQFWERSVALTPSKSPDLPWRLNNLGNGLRERYEQTGSLSDLDRAILVHKDALDKAKMSLQDRLAFLTNLANDVSDRYFRGGNQADLDWLIQIRQQVIDQTDPSSPHLPGYLINLGNELSKRYEIGGELVDLNQAIQAEEQAIALTPSDSPDLPGFLTNLGGWLEERYARMGNLPDLNRAIQVGQQAVDLTPSSAPLVPVLANNLGGALSTRYERTGERADLERAIRNHEEAVAKIDPGSPYFPHYLHNLGRGLSYRYELTGDLSDLERAILAQEEAVKLTSPTSPELTARLNSLAVFFRQRYDRTWDLADLERAICLWEFNVQQTPIGSPKLPVHLNNLGAAFVYRYMRAGNVEGLNRAIELWQQAIEQTAPDSPAFHDYTNNLSCGLEKRHEVTGSQEDLDRAIELCEQAVTQTPPDSPALLDYLNNLSNVLHRRYELTRCPEDLDRAIELCKEAVARIPPDSPALPDYLSNLARKYIDRHTLTGALADLEQNIEILERFWFIMQTNLFSSLVEYSLGQQQHWSAIYADLVTAHLRYALLRPSAAEASYKRALEVAESTKSRLLTESVTKGDLSVPCNVAPEQAAREKELLSMLANLDATSLATHGLPFAGEERVMRVKRLQQRTEYRRELAQLWEIIAQHGPQASEYVALRRGSALDWDQLAELADNLGQRTALLSLFLTARSTLIFVLRRGYSQPAVVEANIDPTQWTELMRGFFKEIHCDDGSSRPEQTWSEPLQLLLKEVASKLHGVERIILAPHGYGHLIPWTVLAWQAGWRGAESLPIPLVTIPTLALLPVMQHRNPYTATNALVIGNPTGNLKYAENEAREVASILGTNPLIYTMATKSAVIQHLSNSSIIHLATHAHFNSDSPLDSTISLADGTLAAREVIEQRLHANLVVLSACQTGMVKPLGGDELAGLAIAYFYAGARSLLVSLWSVDDPATAALMTAYYNAGGATGDKAVALSKAVSHVQAEGKWSHPYYWGAFVLMGSE